VHDSLNRPTNTARADLLAVTAKTVGLFALSYTSMKNAPLLYTPDYNGNLTSTSGGGVKIPFPIDVFLYYFVFNSPRLTSGN
jgi:hypothetical protein